MGCGGSESKGSGGSGAPEKERKKNGTAEAAPFMPDAFRFGSDDQNQSRSLFHSRNSPVSPSISKSYS